MEAEHFQQNITRSTPPWLIGDDLVGSVGDGYVSVDLDLDLNLTESYTTAGAELQYALHVTTPGTYTVWLRGWAPNGAGDSVHLGLNGQPRSVSAVVSGFSPRTWTWSNQAAGDGVATLQINEVGPHTIHLWLREDGLKVDRLLLTTDNFYEPVGDGPAESNLGLY